MENKKWLKPQTSQVYYALVLDLFESLPFASQCWGCPLHIPYADEYSMSLPHIFSLLPSEVNPHSPHGSLMWIYGISHKLYHEKSWVKPTKRPCTSSPFHPQYFLTPSPTPPAAPAGIPPVPAGCYLPPPPGAVVNFWAPLGKPSNTAIEQGDFWRFLGKNK